MIAEVALAAGRVSVLKLAGWGPRGPRPKGPKTRPAGPLKPLEPQPKSPDPDDLAPLSLGETRHQLDPLGSASSFTQQMSHIRGRRAQQRENFILVRPNVRRPN
eukprot:4155598-Pyramimonas_sp.AAC.1